MGGEKAIAEIEERGRSFGLVSSQPPTVVEVDPFPSGSVTLDKDTVGDNIWILCTILIYINPAFDVYASPRWC